MHGIIHPLTMLFVKHPKLGGIFGLILALAFGCLGIMSWNSLQKMPLSPIHTSLEQSASLVSNGKDAWVDIGQVKWDCQNIVPQAGTDSRTDVVFTDETASIVGVAIFSESNLKCEDLQEKNVGGILSQMDEAFYSRLASRGFHLDRYKNAAIKLSLCTFCSRNNSIGLVILGTGFTILGLAMYPICLMANRRYRKKGMI